MPNATAGASESSTYPNPASTASGEMPPNKNAKPTMGAATITQSTIAAYDAMNLPHTMRDALIPLTLGYRRLLYLRLLKSQGQRSIVFLGDRMFVSTDSPCGGSLVEFDIDTGVATVLGGDGLGCVYGLANVDDVIYVVNCDGKIGTFDPDTGSVRIVASASVTTYGADTLP